MSCGKHECSCETMTGLAHIGVFVQDISKSKEFYTDVLCFECFFETDIDTEEGVVKVAFVKQGSCVLELVELPSHEKRSTQGVVAHIAIDVEDINLMQICLEKKGIKFETEKPVHLPMVFDNGVKFINFRGPDGETIELNQTL